MRRNSLLPLVAALTLVGCNGWLTEAPEDFFTPGDFPSTEPDLKIALAGIDDWYTGGSNQPYFIRGWPILSEDASAGKGVDLSQSIADCRIRSMMCVPLVGRTSPRPFGVIQLDTQDRFKQFTQDDLKMLLAVAGQAAVALENATMHATIVQRAGLERDLLLARKVQESFLPLKMPLVTGYEFMARYESAQEVGGDYYDFIPLHHGRYGIMVGDVA